MNRRATSLVEVLVFGLLGLLVIVGAFEILQRTSRQSARTQERLRALQAVGMLTERIAHDLTGEVTFRRNDRELKCTVTPDGRIVEFYRYDSVVKREQPVDPVAADGTVTLIRAEAVSYTFDPAKGAVLRRVGTGKPELALSSRFASVRFSLPQAGDARLLGVRADWIPEERLARPVAERGETVRLECMLGLTGEAGSDGHPYRVANPTSRLTL